MSIVPAGFDGKSDAELIASVRAGTLAAYGALYERHVGAAYNLARQLARSTAESDDLVSEAFAKVLDTLRAGRGPDTAFRAYLLTALRHTAYDKTRKDKRVDLNEDMTAVNAEALTVPFSDTAVAGLERTLAAKAFARLPERWQAVLWHTEIEQQTPAEVAPLLGLTANGVSALAYRAREGLRQAYLQVHLAETSAERCRAAADRLGAWTRAGLSKRERAQVESHLDECERCQALAAELSDVNGALRAVVAPIVLGGAVLAYLATAGAGKASAATAVGVGMAGSSTAAASATTEGPRQVLTVAASGVAIATAVVIALVTGGGGAQQIPAAAQSAQPPPAQVVPAPAPVPVPVPPAGEVPNPPPAIAPAPATSTPGAAPIQSTTAPAPAPAPAPGPAKLSAAGPAGGIELQSGGDAIPLPITVRNEGESVSEQVTATLDLPAGFRAVGPGGGGGTVGAHGLAVEAGQVPLALDCPAGEGTVTCTTDRGLRPGETAVLTFRLSAGSGARPGEATGSVTAGGAWVAITVPLSVKPAPDAVNLEVGADWFWPWLWPKPLWLAVDVRNDGPNTRPVTVTIDQPATLVLGNNRARCEALAGDTACQSTLTLAPREHLRLWFKVDSHEDKPVTVTAKLGSATATKTVTLRCWPEQPPHPGRPPATTTPGKPATTRPTVTTTTPTTTTRPPGGSEPPPTRTTTTTTTTPDSWLWPPSLGW